MSVHLVGSVPLKDVTEVFRTTATILGDRLSTYPDGEVGERTFWIDFQIKLFQENPAFELLPENIKYTGIKLRMKEGYDPALIDFGALKYAQYALSSYEKFAQLKQEGIIHSNARFQVSLPSPFAPISAYFVPENFAILLPLYEAALFNEVKKICENIPHDQLAIQWDIAVEVAVWEGVFPRPPGDWKNTILHRLANYVNFVPQDVLVGAHFCYGDKEHKHFTQPKDLSVLVEIITGVQTNISRLLNWVHVPVPIDRFDEAYYAPLQSLKLSEHTRLFLGLVHLTDGVEGTRRRIEVAKHVLESKHTFGIATECGMGRRKPDTIVELLNIHQQCA